MLNPLSARQMSIGSNLQRIPDFSTSCLSDIAPPAAFEIKETVPPGVQATSTFAVGLDL